MDRKDEKLGPPLNEDEKLFHRAFLKRALFRELRRVFQHLREEKGVTQADIARRLGVHEALVSRRLGGDVNLTLNTVADLAAAMRARIEPRAITEDEAVLRASVRAVVFVSADGVRRAGVTIGTKAVAPAAVMEIVSPDSHLFELQTSSPGQLAAHIAEPVQWMVLSQRGQSRSNPLATGLRVQ